MYRYRVFCFCESHRKRMCGRLVDWWLLLLVNLLSGFGRRIAFPKWQRETLSQWWHSTVASSLADENVSDAFVVFGCVGIRIDNRLNCESQSRSKWKVCRTFNQHLRLVWFTRPTNSNEICFVYVLLISVQVSDSIQNSWNDRRPNIHWGESRYYYRFDSQVHGLSFTLITTNLDHLFVQLVIRRFGPILSKGNELVCSRD